MLCNTKTIRQKGAILSDEPRLEFCCFLCFMPGQIKAHSSWFSGDLNQHCTMYGGENHLQASKNKMCECKFESVLFVQFSSCLFFSFTFKLQFMHKVSKEQIIDFMCFYSQKTNIANIVKLGYGCINGCIAWKQLISAEGSKLRKCR